MQRVTAMPAAAATPPPLTCLQVLVKQGDTMAIFLKAVREQLAPEFRELRSVSVDNLMYIKVGGGHHVTQRRLPHVHQGV